MVSAISEQTLGGSLDRLDWRIVQALQVNGRASSRRIASALGTSEQTVARRMRGLTERIGLRVVGLTDCRAIGVDRWLIRVRCTPGAGDRIADALARRPDTAWIQLLSGGTEIWFRVEVPRGGETPLLDRLPNTPQVLAVDAHCQLRTFVGGDLAWGRSQLLTADERAQLRDGGPEPAERIADPRREPVSLDPEDDRLIAELATDGRARVLDLSRKLATTESSVRRRIERLRRLGALFFDLQYDPARMGYRGALLWLAVAPSELAAIGERMVDTPQVAFAAATTGPTNLVAIVVYRDTEDLYDYLTSELGAIPGVQQVQSAPIMRTVKQGGPVIPLRRRS